MEAFAKKDGNPRFGKLSPGDVTSFVAAMDAERVSEKHSVGKSDQMLFRENEAGVSYDLNGNGQMLYRSCVNKK
jgi:hypothetical protein